MPDSSRQVRVERVELDAAGAARREWRPDRVATEEPLQIVVHTSGAAPTSPGPVSVLTMRTPGHDIDLALGWLVGERVVGDVADVVGVEQRGGGEGLYRAGAVHVRLRHGLAGPDSRTTVISSACGVCGADRLALGPAGGRWPVADDPVVVPATVLAGLPASLRARQATFERTGGLHAAGLFGPDGSVVVVREDVGRHNAVDKVLGYAQRHGLLPLRGHVLQVSGRASMELVDKAVAGGVPVLAAVSAPSSMAVDLAREHGLTLAGFIRDGRMTVYSRADRVA